MASNVSDIIEKFILSVIGDEESIKLSRNELANYFSVAPSQINYVLSTRFCLDKGYVVESKRGGGGFVLLARLSQDEAELLPTLIKQLDEMQYLTFNRAEDIADRLLRDKIIDQGQCDIIKFAISDRALATPMIAQSLRKNVMKEILIGLMRR
ncbi:MAG: CtsR family transcriptional regulator [Clostridia bacterium]